MTRNYDLIQGWIELAESYFKCLSEREWHIKLIEDRYEDYFEISCKLSEDSIVMYNMRIKAGMKIDGFIKNLIEFCNLTAINMSPTEGKYIRVNGGFIEYLVRKNK